MTKKLIIVGGGASGLFAAFAAASNNSDLAITILDANSCAGKKLLVTGNGRCNLTNTDIDESKYYCDDSKFVKNILNRYHSTDVINEFARLGIALRDKNGYIYPESMQASTISAGLISICTLLGVKLIYNCYVNQIKVNNTSGFELKTDTNMTYTCDYLILAYGSNAGLNTDYTSALNNSLTQLGHRIKPMLPSLCSLYVDKKASGYREFFKKAGGVRAEISVRPCMAGEANDDAQICHTGELQITEYGLSGIVIFQISHIISRMFSENGNKEALVCVDFLPTYTVSEALKLLREQYFYEKKTLLDLFNGLLNTKLALAILNLYSFLDANELKPHMKNISETKLYNLLSFVKNVPFKIIGTNDIRHSQVCAGGIDISDIRSDTLESKLVSNLYFCGECIDVDGICGGYNLQWAWSTGYIAGTNIAKEQTDD